MRSFALVAVLVGLASTGLAACSAIGSDDSGSSADDFSHDRGPGNGRRPIGPQILASDASADASDAGAADPDAAAILATDPDGSATDTDGGTPPLVASDSGTAPKDGGGP